MNNDKLTTIDDETLDNVSGGASVGDAVFGVIDSSIKLADALIDARIDAHQNFWAAVKAFRKAFE